MLAHALLRHPKVLFVDKGFSAIDLLAKKRIQDKLLVDPELTLVLVDRVETDFQRYHQVIRIPAQ